MGSLLSRISLSLPLGSPALLFVMGLSASASVAASVDEVAANPRAVHELGVAEVLRREVPRTFLIDGKVEAVNQSTVAAQISGQIAEVRADVDDLVEQGAILVVLNDAEPRSQVEQAEANLNTADASLAQASADFARIKDIYAKELVSKSELDKATRALKSARAARKAAKAALDRAREQLDYTVVRAPYTGIVTERHREVGEIVQPGQPLMSGISLEKLRVVVEVPQSLIYQVRQIQQASVQVTNGRWEPVEKMTIFPIAEPGSSAFTVRLDLPEGAHGLFPGMFVKSAFVIGQRSQLSVPQQAVVFRSEVVGIYVIDSDERVRFRRIRLGHRSSDWVGVLSGLNEGERVALDPIAAGIALKAQQSSAASQPAE